MEQNVFSQNTIEQAINAIKAHEAVIKSMKEKTADTGLEDVAQELLMEKFGISQIEAEEIVTDLLKGIKTFDNQYKTAVEQEKMSVAAQLSEITKDMGDGEKTVCYANILTALQLLDNDTVARDIVEERQKENAKKSIEELTSEIEALFNNNIALETLAEVVQSNVDKAALSKIAKNIEMKKDEYRFLTALWLYIDQREGNIQFAESDIKLPATSLGVLAGASIEALIATNDLNEGKIDLKRWQVIMKWILGTAFIFGVLVLTAYAGAIVGLSVIGLFMSVFGISLLSFIAALVLAVGLCWCLGDAIADSTEKLLNYLSIIYDKYIVIATQKASKWIVALKEWVNKTRQKAKDMKEADGIGENPANGEEINPQTGTDTIEGTFAEPALA